jgi:hypothetical protein
MVAFVTAVVGVDQHVRRGRQRREQAAQVAVVALNLAQITLTHPPIVMSSSVDSSQVNKGKVRLVGQDMGDGGIGDFVIAFVGCAGVAVPRKLQGFWPAQVAQRFPVMHG